MALQMHRPSSPKRRECAMCEPQGRPVRLMSEDEYTPTTEQILGFIRDEGASRGDAGRAGEGFFRWLAAHDAEVTEALRAEVARLDDFTTVVALSRDRDEWKARAKASEAKIAAVEAVCAGIEVLPVPHSPMMSQTDITKRIIGTIIRAVRAALTDEPRP